MFTITKRWAHVVISDGGAHVVTPNGGSHVISKDGLHLQQFLKVGHMFTITKRLAKRNNSLPWKIDHDI